VVDSQKTLEVCYFISKWCKRQTPWQKIEWWKATFPV